MTLRWRPLVQSCDERVFLNGAFDEVLLPFVSRAAAEPGKQLIFVNLFGKPCSLSRSLSGSICPIPR